MTARPYPDDEDLQALAAAHGVLADRGVRPGRHGYDVATLAAAAYAHGWSYGIDLTSGTYRAEMRPQSARMNQTYVAGVGWTPEAALAFALAQALRRAAVTEDGQRSPWERTREETTAT